MHTNLQQNAQRPLRRAEASDYLLATYGLSYQPNTLAKIACTSSAGPRFIKAGKFPLYPVAELDAFAASIMSPLKRSTSDVGEAA